MKGQIKLTKNQAELLGAGYMCIKNSIEILRMLNREPDLSFIIKNYLSDYVSSLVIVQDKMDRRLNCNAAFESDVKNNDTLRLLEISRIFQSLNTEGQAAMEEMILAIKNHDDIKIEVV